MKQTAKLLSFPILSLILLSMPRSTHAAIVTQEKSIVRPNVIVSAAIGIPKMTLWGYASPDAHIELAGVGVAQTTVSDSNGYYSFDLIYLPNTASFPELCLTGTDSGGIGTFPTCIPPITGGNYFFNVGPVILPPTISLGTPQTNPGSQVSAQGTTIPNSTVEIKLARPDVNRKGLAGFRIVRQARAYFIPSYSVTSDSKGGYSFNMPVDQGVTWRVFAVTDYRGGGKSPKSNTLVFETLTTGVFVIKSVSSFLSQFLHWPGIIVLEFLLILILLAIALVVSRGKKRREKEKQPTVEQNYSNIVERYQDFLSVRKSNF